MAENSDASEDVQKELNQLREDLQSMRGDMSELVQSIADLGRQRASGLGDEASQQLHDRLEQLEQTYGRAQQRGKEAYGDMERRIRERPLTSLCFALGLGVVLGTLLHRR